MGKSGWTLSQVFGEESGDTNGGNIITSLQFDPTGQYLSVGYACGQIVIFKRRGDEFKFYTQFNSHEPEFDVLTSLEVDEKINKIRWFPWADKSHYLLATNDKTVKLWKMYEHMPRFKSTKKEPEIRVVARKTFSGAHNYNINSITFNSDGETWMSADDLRVNLWNLNVSDEAFTVVDTKPDNMEELKEVITITECHPFNCHTFLYSTSKGEIRQVDMRIKALCDKHVATYVDAKNMDKGYFSELINSICDLHYTKDGNFIYARDFMGLKIWDVRQGEKPLKTYQIHEHLRPKLYDLYENDCLFDKFELAVTPNDGTIISGSYGNNFYSYDVKTSKCTPLEAIRPNQKKKKPEDDKADFQKKVLQAHCNPKDEILAIAAANYLYLYSMKKK